MSTLVQLLAQLAHFSTSGLVLEHWIVFGTGNFCTFSLLLAHLAGSSTLGHVLAHFACLGTFRRFSALY